MKYLSLLIFTSAFFPLTLLAQKYPQRILGTFLYKDGVYNYEFVKAAEDNFSFRISSVTEKPREEPAKKKDSSNTDTIPIEAPAEANDTLSEAVARFEPNISAGTANPDEDGSKPSDTNNGFVFFEFSQDPFITTFKGQMLKYKTIDDRNLKDKALEVFFKIKTRLEFIDDEPVTAYMVLKYDKVNSLLRSNTSAYYDGSLSGIWAGHRVHDVYFETDGGAIKNIKLKVVHPNPKYNYSESPRRFLEFKNLYPITISGKFDPDKFAEINLYCLNCNGIKGLTRYIKLSDLMVMAIVLENDKEDYSPANRVFLLTPTNPIVEMKKERRSRILEVAAFSDFMGLDRNEPNGLIQIEAKRKIFINTKSRPLVRYRRYEGIAAQVDFGEYDPVEIPQTSEDKKAKRQRYRIVPKRKYTNGNTVKKLAADDSLANKSGRAIDSTFSGRTDSIIKSTALHKGDSLRPGNKEEGEPIEVDNRRFPFAYQTWANYIEPRLLFSKLEDNNRFIDSVKAINNTISPISLYKYQIASFGLGMQVYRLNWPQLKLQVNVLNVGAYWSRSRVATTSDSSGPTVALNSLLAEFSTGVVFRPDNRWGASTGFAYIYPKIWNPDYKLGRNRGLFQFQFDGYLKTSDEGKLFFRYRWTYEKGNKEENFTQVQLGYSIQLFAGSKPGGTAGN